MASRPDDDPPGLPPEWAGFVVPDDISELEADIALVRSEQPPPQRDGALLRIIKTRRWQRFGLSGPLLVIVLLVSVFVSSLVFLLLPSTPHPPAVRALAHPRVAVGQAGGLLPDLALPVGSSDAIRLRSVRPAVVLLLPGGCNCAALVEDVIASTSASRLKVLLVGQGADPLLPRSAPTDRVQAATDTDGQLASVYGLAGQPIALFIRSDGTVSRVLPGATAGAKISDEITGLAG